MVSEWQFRKKSFYLVSFERKLCQNDVRILDGADGGVSAHDISTNWHTVPSGVARKYISHLILYHHTIQPITCSIFPLFWSHSLFQRFRGSSRQCSIISAHPLPMLLEPELLFLTNPFLNDPRGAAECWWWRLRPLAPLCQHISLSWEEIVSERCQDSRWGGWRGLQARYLNEMPYSQSFQNGKHIQRNPNGTQVRENSLRTKSAFRMELMDKSGSNILVQNDLQSIVSEWQSQKKYYQSVWVDIETSQNDVRIPDGSDGDVWEQDISTKWHTVNSPRIMS